MKYNKKFDKIIDKLSTIDDEECQSILEEVELLSTIYQKKEARLNKIIKLSDKQQMAIIELNEELDSYKNDLEAKVEEEILKRKEQEEILFEQSKLAAVAEMTDAIAHQWIQPLNILSMSISILKLESQKNGGTSQEEIALFKEKSMAQIQHLVDTLNNFRDFFKPVKVLKEFSASEVVANTITLIQDELTKYHIDLSVHTISDFTIVGNIHEFKHILLNFISNTKYAFLQNGIKDRKITITILGAKKSLEVIDNAGGIPEEMLESLFDMHTSTKGKHGTGVGLYMSTKIAHKHNGTLSATNTQEGAKFTFRLKD